MRRALLFCAAIAFAIACGDNITEPVPSRSVTPPVSFATSTSDDGLSITTDKDDYSPGDTVHFTGSGWQPGDSLDIVLVDDALTQETHSWAVGIAEDGTFHDSTYVVDVADLGVTFTLTASSRATGRSLTVTFTDGNVKVEGSPAGVRFTLTGATYSNNTCTTGETIRQATSENSSFSFGTGNSNFLKLTVSTTSASGGNFLSWTLDGGGTATTNSICVSNPNGNATYTANYQGKPDLTITKTAGAASFTVGTASSYTLKVDNVGQLATSGAVTVTDEIPAGLTVGTITATGWTCTGTNSLSCTRSDALAAAASYPNIVVAVTPTLSAVPSVTNTALVSGGGDVSAGNNGSTITTPVNAFVDLTIDKSHTGNFTRGTNGTYSIAVTNAGSAATNAIITVTDPLPNGLTFVSGTGTNWTCVGSMGGMTVTCTRPAANSIAIGATAPTITLTVAVANNTNASITNTASVSGGGEPAANNGNNSDSDPTTVVDPVAGPTKLAFTTGAFSRTVNVCSPQITVQTQNASSAPTNPTANTTVNLSSSSAGGTFYSDAACSGGNVITSVTILTTGNTGSFYYKDSNVGSPVLTAAATGLTPATQTETITAVPNVAPVVDAGGPYSGAEGSAIALNQATATDADGDALTYKWTYVAVGTVDAGTSCSFSNDAILQPTFTCNDDGAFTLTLEVGDGHGHTVSDDATVTVGNADPTATFNTPAAAVNEGSSFALSFTGATDASSNDVTAGLRYAFNCGAGYSATDYAGASTTASTSCTTATDGPATLAVKGKVFDNDGGFTEYTGSVTVQNVPPTADAGGPYSGDEGSAIALDGSGDDVSAADKATLTFAWSVDFTGIDLGGSCKFHDPAHPLNAGTATSTLEDPTIVCDDDSKAGTFTVTLHVSDDDGGTSSASNADLTVKNVDPVADAGGPYNGNEGDNIQLHGDATDVGAHDTFEWAWEYTAGPGDLDPGASCQFSDATAQEPTIKCTDDGKVKLTLTVHDDNGGMSSAEATLTLANLPPVAAAGGPYNGAEGSAISLNGSADDPGNNDDPYLTYKWTINTNNKIDGGGTCTFVDDTKKDTKVSCTDDSNDGTFTLSLVAKDDDGGTSVASTAELTVTNAIPIATAGGPYSGNEGSAIQLNGSADDPGNNDDAYLTYKWTVATTGIIDGGGTCTFDNDTKKDAKVTCTDDSQVAPGYFTLSLVATDDDEGVSLASTANLTVSNAPPTITSLNVSPTVVQVGGLVTLSAQFTDPGHNDTHTASINWEDATTPGVVTETNGSGSVSATHTYTATGIYTVSLTVTDDDLGADTETFTQYIVVYDPSAGFVTGGGWINSPVGAYPADPSLVGKANFGFVSKYITQKDKTTPVLTGNTEFQFQAGSLNFSSTAYEWMVVQGSTKASYKGSGTVNGATGYGFLLSVVDGGSTGDKFRMKIWNKATSAPVYDNQLSVDDDATASQLIAGGSIVIHTNGGLATK